MKKIFILILLLLSSQLFGQMTRFKANRLRAIDSLIVEEKNVTSFFPRLDDNNRATYDAIKDSAIIWDKLHPNVQDLITGSGRLNFSGDFMQVSDTTNLKLYDPDSSLALAYLKQLSVTNSLGGGFFVKLDSIYPEGGIAFDNAVSGKQWVRLSYLQDGRVDITWFGALPNDEANSSSSAIGDAIAVSDYIIFGETSNDTFYVTQPILPQSNDVLDLNGNNVKILNRDHGLLAVSYDSANYYFIADVPTLSVGEWVGVTDTTHNFAYDVYRSWCGRIDSIKYGVSRDTIYLDNNYDRDFLTSDSAFWGDLNNVILLDSVQNVTIKNGKVLGDRYDQTQIRPTRDIGQAEQQRAGCGITIWKCTNIKLEDLEVRENIMHNIACTGNDSSETKNIYMNNIKSVLPNEKCFLVRFTDNFFGTNIVADSATNEDGLMFYSTNFNANVANVKAKGNNRYNFGWNGSSDMLTANNIIIEGNQGRFLVNAKSASISNVVTSRPLYATNEYNAQNVSISNLTFRQVSSPTGYCLGMRGKLHKFIFSNVYFDSCDATAVFTDSLSGGSPNEPPYDIKFIGGGFYRHKGLYYNLIDGTDFNFYHWTPEITSGFDPVDSDTRWIWEADSGITVNADTVIYWVDRILGDTLIADTSIYTPVDNDYYIAFNDSDQFAITTSDCTSYDLPSGDFTISFMAQFDTTTTNYLMTKRSGSSNYWQIYQAGYDIYFDCRTSGVTRIYAASEVDKEYVGQSKPKMITLVFDSSAASAQFYVNGGPVETTVTEYTPADYAITGGTFRVGTQSVSGGRYKGRIYWMQFDDVARSEQWAFDYYWYMYNWVQSF